MERYHIRVDRIGDRTLEFLTDWIKKHDIKTYLISEEIGSQTGKVHYQGFVDIDMSKRNEKAWRQNLRDSMHITGRNQVSLTIKHGNLETYICKDGKIILQSNDLHQLQIEQWKTESYNKDSRKDSEGKNNFTKKYLQAMSSLPVKDRHNLTIESIKYFRDNTKVFDKFIIKRFVYLAMATFGDDRLIDKMAESFWDD